MAEFKIGAVVVLKSGGPLMTVEEVGEYGFGPGLSCVWFDGKKRVEALFHRDTVEAAPAQGNPGEFG